MPANADEIELGLIVALAAEAAGLRGRGSGCEVRIAGIGRERAARAAERLVKRGARALLSWGVAGGLSPQLRAGDLLLPRRVVSEQGEWPTDEAWRARLSSAIPGTREIDTLYGSDVPVISLDQKHALANRGFAAVDMESAGVAEAASRAGLPFVAIKAVCDPASRAIPAVALRMLDEDGRLRAAAIFDIARGGPRAWRQLRALRGDFFAACAGLRRAAQNLPAVAEANAP